jgi:hypothetical protein
MSPTSHEASGAQRLRVTPAANFKLSWSSEINLMPYEMCCNTFPCHNFLETDSFSALRRVPATCLVSQCPQRCHKLDHQPGIGTETSSRGSKPSQKNIERETSLSNILDALNASGGPDGTKSTSQAFWTSMWSLRGSVLPDCWLFFIGPFLLFGSSGPIRHL